MFAQIYGVTLRLLLLRAGPQDLPYAPELTPALLALATALAYATFALVTPGAPAVFAAAASCAGVWLLARELLKARKLSNRFAQTLHGLLLVAIALGLVTLWPFSKIAPLLVAAASDSGVLEHPERLDLPQLPMLALNLLAFWKLAANAHVLRNAIDSGFGAGLLLALLLEFVQLSMMMFGALLARVLFG
ncbi:MAG TPA: hypothetical protein VHE37_15485 [Nevskiaceae bacterium]|nr:hypothetical protein [Nevskiaceae bacterium]